MVMKGIKSNKEQQLYVIPSGSNSYSCLGFDVCIDKIHKLSEELGIQVKTLRRGTIATYKEYIRIIGIVADKNKRTGWVSKSELIPEFIGREGERVEVVTRWGDTSRFYIGKSTGFIPCHLEISRNDSSGGPSVCGYPFQSIKFLGKRRH